MRRTCFFAIALLFISCRTIPKFKGQADLCGLIVDENNAPVKDFVIYCRNDLLTNTAITDENGMFVIHDVESGDYKISGQKKNYARMENTSFLFNDRSKIICCQVESIDGVLNSLEQLMIRGEKKKAEELLARLYYDKKSPQEAVLLSYQFLLTDKIREKKKILSSIRKIGKIEDVDFAEYADALEESINEE